jgi:hypothetical protein
MKTKTAISFKIIDVTAKEDSTPYTSDKQSFVDLNQLKSKDITTKKFGTLEKDYFLLDGTYELFPDVPENEELGLWSMSLSDGNGEFENPVVLEIDFSLNHSSIGLTFVFNEATNDYCSNLNIKWYDETETLLDDKNFAPDAAIYFAENMVENYQKVVITFNSTNKPFRYLKLTQIEFGQIKTFGSNELVSAGVLEEVDLISSEIRINTLDLILHSKDTEFSVMNPSGIYSLLQQRQPLTAYIYLDEIKKNMGTFYLEDWSNDNESTILMNAIDLVGVIDGTTFRGGIYSNATVDNIVNQIMTSANAEYVLEESLGELSLSGYIPVCTHREALQQVAFAIGAIVDCSRSDKIKIRAAPALNSGTISYNRKIYGHKVKLKPLVTGVEVTSHKYVATTETISLFEGVLSIGAHEILFGEPAHSLNITGATITESGANYAVINVVTEGNVVLTGKKYTDTTKNFGVYTPSLPAGEKTNVLSVKKGTLVSSNNAAAIAQKIYDYYQLRHQDDGKIILKDESCGEFLTLDSLYEQKIEGYIEKLDINLTGGFIADMTLTGGVI